MATIWNGGVNMELDKRITDKKYIFDCFSTDKAKKYENCHGYFADYMYCFDNLVKCYKGTLKGVCRVTSSPYLTYLNEDEELKRYFNFFLPEEFVMGNVKKEKTYRPYKNVGEFFEKEGLNTLSKICVRDKRDIANSQIVHIVGFGQTKDISNKYVEYLALGSCNYTLENLFNNYEFQLAYTDEFKPFGVEE